MIVFDQLRISDDGDNLIISVHVNNASNFENVILRDIAILTADKASQTTDLFPYIDSIYYYTFAHGLKSADFVLDKGSFDAAYTHTSTDGSTASVPFTGELSNNMFYVYIRVSGAPDECTPCDISKEVTLGVTFDDTIFYQNVMQHTRDLADTCEISKGFIDMILKWNGLKAAIETEHYPVAYDFWKQLILGEGSGGVSYRTKKCGCHG